MMFYYLIDTYDTKQIIYYEFNWFINYTLGVVNQLVSYSFEEY